MQSVVTSTQKEIVKLTASLGGIGAMLWSASRLWGDSAPFVDKAIQTLGYGGAGQIGGAAAAGAGILLLVASTKLVQKLAGRMAEERKEPEPKPALRDCLFEMKGSGGVVRFHVGEKGCVSISEEEFRSLKDSAPLATVVGLGDGVATVERFNHGKLESSAERGGVVLPARSEVRMDCVGMFLGIDLADPAAAFENCWRHSQAARAEGRPEELPPALLRLAQEIDAREPFRVEHAFEGAPCAEADVSRLAFKRAMAKIPKHAAGRDATEG